MKTNSKAMHLFLVECGDLMFTLQFEVLILTCFYTGLLLFEYIYNNLINIVCEIKKEIIYHEKLGLIKIIYIIIFHSVHRVAIILNKVLYFNVFLLLFHCSSYS